MATILGGERWSEQSIHSDDFMCEEEISPLDDDYIREEYESEEI